MFGAHCRGSMNVGPALMLVVFLAVLLAVLVAAPLAAEPPLIEAIKADDLPRVRTLIDQGADAGEQDRTGLTPLYHAIVSGQAEIVRILLDAGADPGAFIFPEGPPLPWGSDALALALSRRAWGVVDVLLVAGVDDEPLHRYRSYQVQRAFSESDPDALEDILSRFVSSRPTLSEVLWYEQSEPGLQVVAGRYYSGLADGSYNLVHALRDLGDSQEICYFGRPEIQLPAATSELRDARVTDRYSVDKAFDANLATSWVEGVDGAGIGEGIVFAIPRDVIAIDIYPGYGEEAYFEPNNRLKSIDLRIFLLVHEITERVTVLSTRRVLSLTAEVADRSEFQTITVQLPEIRMLPQLGMLVAELVIRDVYPGSRYVDTCIAEIRVR
jgi:hypothetical protein